MESLKCALGIGHSAKSASARLHGSAQRIHGENTFKNGFTYIWPAPRQQARLASPRGDASVRKVVINALLRLVFQL